MVTHINIKGNSPKISLYYLLKRHYTPEVALFTLELKLCKKWPATPKPGGARQKNSRGASLYDERF